MGTSGTPIGDRSTDFVVVIATPKAAASTLVAAGERDVVQPDDTPSDIVVGLGVTEEALRRANLVDERDSVFAGRELFIPPPER